VRCDQKIQVLKASFKEGLESYCINRRMALVLLHVQCIMVV
jgi:hypothetical protein